MNSNIIHKKINRRVGRYTKQEIVQLTSMFNEGYSVYKICRSLNRSQNSIRNNLIRLRLIEGEISPKRFSKSKTIVASNPSVGSLALGYIWYGFILLTLSMIFVMKPHFNILEIILFYFTFVIF